MAEPFLGEISPVAFAFAPRGWALCNGQLLAISQSTALFALLGTTYGGDGITTFALPDLRGRVIVSSDGSYPLGATGGLESVLLNVNELASHTHQPMCSTGRGTTGAPAGAVWAGSSSGETLYQTGSSPDGSMTSGAITPTGGSQAHENRQPYLVINFIIALQGIFPTRN